MPQLIDSPPDRIEIRGNLVYFHYPDGAQFAQPVDVAQRVMAMLQSAITDWQAGMRDNVFPLGRRCEH